MNRDNLDTNGYEKGLSHLQEQRLQGPLPVSATRARAARGDCPKGIAGMQLVQIRQGFEARWNDWTLLVESEDRQWILRVQDSCRRVLYTAGRCNREAAEAAGIEFATFFGTKPMQELQWQPYW